MIEANQQTEHTVEKQETPKGEDRVIKVSQIIIDLDNGLGRPQIKEKYSLTATELKALFQVPVLKKRRPKRALTKISFTLVDDVTPTEEETHDENQLRVDTEAQKVEDNVSENDSEDFDTFEIVN
tara:strand:+ start:324 stop:698 length:375 start_codon:yes stop_codon:yes gene_type:complete